MMPKNNQKKILFFIGSLHSGGKERRLVELLTYLKATGNFQMLVVLNSEDIYYKSFFELGIPYKVLKKRPHFKDPRLFKKLFNICREYKPNIIHTWGGMQTFYAIPSSLLFRIPIINSQITSAPPKINRLSFTNLSNQITFKFSKVVLSNSKAGLEAYKVKGKKFEVIYNGVNLSRFSNLKSVAEVKKQYRILTPFTVIMLANISKNKDFVKFVKVANLVLTKRQDVTFCITGRTKNTHIYRKIMELAQGHPNIIFTGRVEHVEELINACDIGVLLSNRIEHGEGLSNTILEYMALSKPVIANDAGGTKELVSHMENGYLINNESLNDICNMILELLGNKEKREFMGITGRKIIEKSFTLEVMGNNYKQLYYNLV